MVSPQQLFVLALECVIYMGVHDMERHLERVPNAANGAEYVQ